MKIHLTRGWDVKWVQIVKYENLRKRIFPQQVWNNLMKIDGYLTAKIPFLL